MRNKYHQKTHKKYCDIAGLEFANSICEYAKGLKKRASDMYAIVDDILKYGGSLDWNGVLRLYMEYTSIRAKVSERKMLIRYGQVEGAIRWLQYRTKQAYSNSLEYKQSIHGWTEQDYISYNKSRAVTKVNLVNRHGELEGTRKWNEYIDRQAFAGCKKEYFIQKYGTDKGDQIYRELSIKKTIKIDNYIAKYGVAEGTRRYIHRWSGSAMSEYVHSNISQKMFWQLLERIPESKRYTVFFAEKNYEYLFNHKDMHGVVFVDFYCATTNKVIEFYGDYYHGNPRKYADDYYNTQIGKHVAAIHDSDNKRIDTLDALFGVETLVVWEYDWRKRPEEMIDKCLKFLNYDN